MMIFSVILSVLVLQSVALSQRIVPSDKMGLLRGEGMGLASAAEFNGFPGPKHVLDLADTLGLTPGQIETARGLMGGVQASARIVGARIVQAEEQLDSLFAAGGRIDGQVVGTLLQRIARLRADLRKIHLDAHVRMREVLTAGQIELYKRIRGYEP